MNFQTVQIINFGLLIVLAGLLIALVAGLPIPRLTFAGVIFAQALVRTYRDWRWGGPMGRRRIPLSLLFSLVIVYLFLTMR